MRKRFLTGATLTIVILCGLSIVVWANGADLSFPAARRFLVTQGYHTGHEAYDYLLPTHTQVVAAKAGQVAESIWQYADSWHSDCQGYVRDRGNYIVLDHGGGVETRYYHLSNTGQQPGVGTSFDRGESMAPSDDTGCSTGPHLHFVLRVDGSARDPYAGTTEWVSGSPIPMGYRDQNGTVHGPFALDYSSIRQKWLDLNGEPGSPLDNDYPWAMVGQGTDGTLLYEQVQFFEHGYIGFASGWGTTYYPYAKTYLPDVRADKNADGWNSTIIVRNNGSGGATVNVTFYATEDFYTGSGHVLDSRTYYPTLPAGGVWQLSVRSALLDYLNETYGLYPDMFEGSATVYASQDVSVVVMNVHQGSPYAAGSYVGLTQSAATLYLPLLQRANNSMYSDFTVFNVGTASTNVQVIYTPVDARYVGCTTDLTEIPANGSRNVNLLVGPECTAGAMSSPFVGGAKLTSQNGQPLVAVANEWRYANGSIDAFENYEAFPTGYTPNYLPVLQRSNNNWFTSTTFQDTAGVDAPVTINYFRENEGVRCGQYTTNTLESNGIVIVFPSPPGGTCGTFETKFVGAARANRGGYTSAVVVNQEEYTLGKQKGSYSATGGGTTKVIVPWVMKEYGTWQGRSNWWTGLNVQNTGTSATGVIVTYYDLGGTWLASSQYDVPAKSMHVFFPTEISSNNACSAVVTTTGQPIAVVANHWSGSSEDTFMSHIGLNR